MAEACLLFEAHDELLLHGPPDGEVLDGGVPCNEDRPFQIDEVLQGDASESAHEFFVSHLDTVVESNESRAGLLCSGQCKAAGQRWHDHGAAAFLDSGTAQEGSVLSAGFEQLSSACSIGSTEQLHAAAAVVKQIHNCSGIQDLNAKFENPMEIRTTEGVLVDSSCDSCVVLDRMLHTNGLYDTRLEIHVIPSASFGHLLHAILQTRLCSKGEGPCIEQNILELSHENDEFAAEFLLHYNLLRGEDGFSLCFDSFTSTLDARQFESLAAQSAREQVQEPSFTTLTSCPESIPSLPAVDSSIAPKNSAIGSSLEVARHSQSSTPQDVPGGDSKEAKAPKRKQPSAGKLGAAQQRERTGRIQLLDLAKFFHLPINDAAKELGICPTVLKKICRRHNMRRWPHRKIKSIERIVATLEETIATSNGNPDEQILREIESLKKEKEQLCAGILGDL